MRHVFSFLTSVREEWVKILVMNETNPINAEKHFKKLGLTTRKTYEIMYIVQKGRRYRSQYYDFKNFGLSLENETS